MKLLTLRRFVSRSSVYCVWCGGVECNFIQSAPRCLCNDRREHVDRRNGDISQPSVTTISTLHPLLVINTWFQLSTIHNDIGSNLMTMMLQLASQNMENLVV